MKTFNIDGARLRDAIAAVKPCITSKVYAPVLQNIRVKTSGAGMLTFTATDLELYTSADLWTTGPEVDLLINAAELINLSKFAGKKPVTLTIDDERVTATCDGSSMTLTANADVSTFPEWPPQAGALPTFQMGAPELKAMLTDAAVCISRDATKPTLSAVRLETREGFIHTIGTDGFRMAVVKMWAPQSNDPACILPARFVKALPGKSTADFIVSTDTLWTFVQGNDYRAAVRNVQGNYPAWWKVIPSELPLTLGMDRVRFLSGLAAVKVKADKYNHNVELIARDGALTLRFTHPDTGTAEATLPCEGPDVTLAFNIHYLEDLAKNWTGPVMRYEYKNDVSQGSFRCDDPRGFNSQVIAMPVKFSR